MKYRFFDLKDDLEREMWRPNSFNKIKKFFSQNTPPRYINYLEKIRVSLENDAPGHP